MAHRQQVYTTNPISTVVTNFPTTQDVVVKGTVYDGTNAHWELAIRDSGGELLSYDKPFWARVADGEITEYTRISLNSYNADIDASVETIWPVGGAYVFPGIETPSGTAVSVVSSSVLDAPSGSGTQRIQIDYMDAAYSRQQTLVTMNGTGYVVGPTGVLAVTNVLSYVNGSGYANAGAIDVVRTAATGTIYARMPVGENKASFGSYTVNADSSLYITSLKAAAALTASGQYVKVTIEAEDYMHEVQTDRQQAFTPIFTTVLKDNSVDVHFENPLKIQAGNSIRITACGDASCVNAYVTASLEAFEVMED
jgi:hypothetical protein